MITDQEAVLKLAKIKTTKARPYKVEIFIGGDLTIAKAACQKFCDEKGECVTVEATDYIYTGGNTKGVRVGLINYGRFPRNRRQVFDRAVSLSKWLLICLDQESCTVMSSDRNHWMTTREKNS